MRKSLQRALALASSAPVLAATLVAGAPAAHADIAPTCGLGSTALVDFYTLGGYRTRIASYDVSSSVKNICIEVAGTVQTVLVVKSGVALTPPSVTQTPGIGTCSQRIIDMTAPVSLALSVGATTTGPAICLGQNGVTTTVSFNAASVQSTPDIDVWTMRYSWLNLAACADEYALGYYFDGYDVYWDGYYYNQCYSTDNRLI